MSNRHYIIPIFISHVGCPHQCVFCNQDKIARSLEKEVTGEEVKETVEEYLKTIDRKKSTVEISFFGGTFTAIDVKKQKELLEVAREYKDKGYIQKIRMSTRPDAINKYILDYLKDYKVDIIELGVQSLNNNVLRLSGRGHSVEDVYLASKLIKDHGFTLGHQIMPGLPGDDFIKDIETAKKSIEMKPDICRIYPSLVIKETPMEDMYNKGLYKPYTVEEAVNISKELYKLYKEANVNIIRIGLQPTESITLGKNVIAGPFHPAFRELVESSLICDRILERTKDVDNILIEINSRDLSKLYANKKTYFNCLKEKRIGSIEVIENNKLKRGNINLKVIEKTEKVDF
ncbi:radical SAM protein [Clostridium sp.]|uniref:elongator complex protein 3 n=1 Tax=Clostridium sp. TaxID=1506 RepID=UPI0026391321|nr:radical SAM protein [Clostridium sp.]